MFWKSLWLAAADIFVWCCWRSEKNVHGLSKSVEKHPGPVSNQGYCGNTVACDLT